MKLAKQKIENKTLLNKYLQLQEKLKGYGEMIVAFSGGVDSSFLLSAAAQVLPEQVSAVTITTPFIPPRDLDDAISISEQLNVDHEIISINVLEYDSIVNNPVDRCYHCKLEIFNRIKQLAEQNNILNIIEGSNVDDLNDYRPGTRALAELGIHSPLREVGLTKSEIRALSKELGLETWSKPSAPCLATRIPYGTVITQKSLDLVKKGEAIMREAGAVNPRVRIHESLARIEIDPAEFFLLTDDNRRKKIIDSFQGIGFTYVTIDLQGYRPGSMNTGIDRE